jgi:WD40 repeat protein
MPGSELFIPRTFPPEEPALLAFSPRGDRLAVSHEDADHVQVFDARSGKPLRRLEGFHRVTRVLFLSAEVLVVTAFGGCYRCNLRRGPRDLVCDEGWQNGVALSPDRRLLAVGVGHGLLLYDLVKGKEPRRFAAVYDCDHTGRCAAFSAQGRYVAAALYGGHSTPIVPVWEVETGRRQRLFDTWGYAFAFREDTLTLAVSADGYVEIYEPDQGEEAVRRCFFDSHLPQAMESRDGGRSLAMLLDNGEFVQIDWDSGEALRRIPPPDGRKPSAAAADSGWTRFAGAVEDGVVVWTGDPAA